MKQLRFTVAMFMILFGLTTFSSAQDQASQYMLAGNAAYGVKNYDLAINNYQLVLQGNPNYWQAYQGLGNCYYAKGQYNDALANYQKALALKPNNPPVAGIVQTLQANAGISVPRPPASNSNAASPGGAGKAELDIMAGGDFTLSATNPLTNANSDDGETVPFVGGYGIGGGGGLGVYFPLSRNFLIGANAAFYAYGANYNYFISELGDTAGITELFNQSNVEVLAAAKYRFDGNGVRPYLLGGLGFALVSFSESVTVVATEDGDVVENEGLVLPSYSIFCPMFQVGFGAQFPAGNNMDFFVEGKFGFIFIGSTKQTVNYVYESESYTTPSSTQIEFPIDVGLNFNL